MLQQRQAPRRRRPWGVGLGALLLVGALVAPVLVVAVFGAVVATLFFSAAAAPAGLDLGTGVAASRCDLLTPARLAAIASLPPVTGNADPSSWGAVLLDSAQYAELKAAEDPDLEPAGEASVIDALAVVWCALHAAALEAGSWRDAEDIVPLTSAALGTAARTGVDVLAVAPMAQARERWEQVLALEALYAEQSFEVSAGPVAPGEWTRCRGCGSIRGTMGSGGEPTDTPARISRRRWGRRSSPQPRAR